MTDPAIGGARRPRSRPLVAALIGMTVLLGLGSRRLGDLPAFVIAYAGDALWAAMVFWIFAFARPSARTGRLAAAALLFAFAIEASQLYHAPWIDALRNTVPGALVLGQGFLPSDLACYAAGVAAAALVDLVMRSAP